MGDYFKPLRRKFGVVTLVITTLTIAIWIRAQLVTDLFVVGDSRGCRIWEIRSRCLLLGKEDAIGNARYGRSHFWSVCPRDFPSSKLYSTHQTLDARDWEWRVRGYGFDFGRTRIKNPQDGFQLSLWVIPLWSIAFPWTGLSAWLLLSKPRTSPRNTRLHT